MKHLIISQGGAGKQILLTAVVSAMKAQQPESEIIVASSWPECFAGNPDIHQVINLQQGEWFWWNYIQDFDGKIHAHDPYMDQRWLNGSETHLRDIWLEMMGFEASKALPKISVNEAELTNLALSIQTQMPIALVQLNGGSSDTAQYHWGRDVKWQEIQNELDTLARTHFIVQIGTAAQKWNHYPNAQWVDNMSLRQIIVLAQAADAFIGIDSSMTHARAASSKGGKVYYVASTPERIGWYNMQNIGPSPESLDLMQEKSLSTSRTKGLLPFDLNGIGVFTEECPFPAGWKIF